ncbi:unnamed protein product [Cylindrotheca closterium]|uniref:EamA domain-containing protein n=1 Tax=Cylindrotheca closterium TaxID=2856 RepID=A0AAD2JKB7_9STRA|nr:unnamed protein product [Cylindrotheca closterium]
MTMNNTNNATRKAIPSYIRKATLMATCLAIATISPAKAFQQPQKQKFTASPKTASSISSDIASPPIFPRNIQNYIPNVDSGTNPTQQPQSQHEEQPGVITTNDSSLSLVDKVMNSYLGPRILLASVACFYGTNFPLGSIMDHALPASAASSGRFLLAGLALSPFLAQIKKEYIGMSVLAGCFTATGYVAQSLALVDTPAATVSFLGAASVIWCPLLEAFVDKKPMSVKDRPQTWLAGILCIMGVGVLELCGGAVEGSGGIGMGDALALLQAICFSTGIFIAEKMVHKHPDQALPVTSVMVATTALVSMIWALTDGWMGTPGWESMTLPGLFMDPAMHEVAGAVVWTGIMSTSLSFFLENFSLQNVPPAEATVILSTEPLWAAGFASILLGESFGMNDYVGGGLMLAACMANSLKPKHFQALMRQRAEEDDDKALER